jgi:hypothetical protein
MVPVFTTTDVKLNRKHQSVTKTDTVFCETDTINPGKKTIRVRTGPGFPFPIFMPTGRVSPTEKSQIPPAIPDHTFYPALLPHPSIVQIIRYFSLQIGPN